MTSDGSAQTLPFALLIRMLFRRSGINVAEALLMPNPATYAWATVFPYLFICAHAAAGRSCARASPHC